MTTAHGALVKLVMREVGAIPDTLIFKRFSGNLWTREGAMVQSSVPGQCDLWGVHSMGEPFGGGVFPVHFEIEAKVGDDRLNEHQRAWRMVCLSMEIPHHVAHAKSTDRAELERVAKEAASWINSL